MFKGCYKLCGALLIDTGEPRNLSSKDKGEIGDVIKEKEARRGEVPQA